MLALTDARRQKLTVSKYCKESSQICCAEFQIRREIGHAAGQALVNLT